MPIKGKQQPAPNLSKQIYPQEILQVSSRIYHLTGYGPSNCTIIEGETAMIVIAPFDSKQQESQVLTDIRTLIKKPIKTLNYIRSQPEHSRKTGDFKGCSSETDKLSLKEAAATGEGRGPFSEPTNGLGGERALEVVDGVLMQFLATAEVAGNAGIIWFPEEAVLYCDTHHCDLVLDPALSNAKQIRNLSQRFVNLEKMLACNARIVLSKDAQVLAGKERVSQVLSSCKKTIAGLLTDTLKTTDQPSARDQTT